MKNNYHTHTPRCNHAVGSEEEYVENDVVFDEIQDTIQGISELRPWKM